MLADLLVVADVDCRVLEMHSQSYCQVASQDLEAVCFGTTGRDQSGANPRVGRGPQPRVPALSLRR